MSDTLISKTNLETAVKRIASEMESAVSNVEIDLYDGVDSTATDIAATANAVKQAYDLAASASSSAASAGDGPFYCTCSTADGTAGKTASCSVDFTVANGVCILVKFAYPNTATSGVTLKVSTPTGTAVAYPIAETSSGSTCSPWNAGDIIQLVYENSAWVQVNKIASATNYGLVRKGSQTISSSGTVTVSSSGYVDNDTLADFASNNNDLYALKKIYGNSYISLNRDGDADSASIVYGYKHTTTSSISATGKGAVAIGTTAGSATMLASGNGSRIEGTAVDNTTSEGVATSGVMEASGFGSVVEGYATGGTMTASGNGSKAAGNCSGYVTASGSGSYARGDNVIAAGKDSHTEGYNNSNYFCSSHVEGYGNTFGTTDSTHTNIYDAGHVEGYGNTLTGSYGSHGEGVSNTSDSDYTHIEGNQNTITGSENCHVEGYKNAVTSGTTNHVEGVGHDVRSGIYSHAEGGYVSGSTTYGNKLGGTCSHIEGARNEITAHYVHVEGYHNVGAVNYSHVEGMQNNCYSEAAHVEGSENNAYSKANYCHIEGKSNKVYGAATHIEGNTNLATYPYVHIEGYNNTIGDVSNVENEQENGDCTGLHIEGYQNTVYYGTGIMYGTHVGGHNNTCTPGVGCYIGGCNNAINNTADYAHVSGYQSVVHNSDGFAHGYYTEAYTVAEFVVGQCNTVSTTAGSVTSTAGNAFVIGNGTGPSARNNAFRVTKAGVPYAQGALNTSGADYAEFVKEWSDGNENNEDRVGYFVTLKNDKLCFANEGDYIIGVTSGAPSIVGSSDIEYRGKFLYDEFGRIIMEDDKFKLNPDYDSSQTYIQRIDRPEWDYVGMLGIVYVRDDGTCNQYEYCKCGTSGIATAATERGFDTYFVVERTADNIIKIMLK